MATEKKSSNVSKGNVGRAKKSNKFIQKIMASRKTMFSDDELEALQKHKSKKRKLAGPLIKKTALEVLSNEKERLNPPTESLESETDED